MKKPHVGLSPYRIRVHFFAERLQQLDPLFDELDQALAGLDRSASQLPFRRFERNRVKAILTLYFITAYGKRSGEAWRKTKATKRTITLVQRLLKRDPPEFVKTALAEWRGTLQSDLRFGKWEKAVTYRTCPTLSQTTTALADYLFNVYAVRTFFPTAAAIYQLIGKILAIVTTPECPACGRAGGHAFPTKNRVWKLDKKRERRRQKLP